MFVRVLSLSIAVTLALTGAAQAQKWGDLTGQFIYDGPADAKPIVPTKDTEVCSKHKLVDEAFVVNAESKGIANVVVWLFPASGAKVEAHPDYKATATAKIKVDNSGCRFEPHVAVVRVGQTLEVGNSDPVGHNTKIDTLNNPAINPIIPASGSFDTKFASEETLPATISCSIHPWMTGRLIVKDHPYVAISDKDGKFTFKNLPAGDWNFKVWHEANGYAKDINGTALKKGVWAQTVKEGASDLGKLKITLKQ